MLRNYLIIAWRNLLRHKLFSFINIMGLSVGIAACLLITLFVVNELSFDRYHQHADRIYRIVVDKQTEGGIHSNLLPPSTLATTLQREFPEIVASVRLTGGTRKLKYKDLVITANVFSADPEIFDVFTLPIIKGNPATLLKEPNTIVISEKIANTYFPGENPVGQIIMDAFGFGPPQALTVTGVMKNMPAESHFHADMLVPMFKLNAETLNWQAYTGVYQYLLVAPGTKASELEQKFSSIYKQYKFPERTAVRLQPLTAIHLYSNLERELEPNSDIRYVYIFSVTAFFILLIACINFINLSTARSLKRAREVGVRKVLGAQRQQLIWQLLGEALLYFGVALILGITLVQLMLIPFQELLDRKFSILSLGAPVLAGIVLSIFLVCLLASAYPALYLSAQHPVQVLKGVLKTTTLNARMRKVLVVVQFSISIILIIATAVVYSQLHYISSKRLGFNKEQLLVLPNQAMQGKGNVLKQQLLQSPSIISASISSWYPGLKYPMGGTIADPKNPSQEINIHFIAADVDFIKTLQIELAEGRTFQKEITTDMVDLDSLIQISFDELIKQERNQSIILNEAAVKRLGLQPAIGQKLNLSALRGMVIGVAKDFNGLSLHHEITPVVVKAQPNPSYGSVLIRIHPQHIPATLNFIEKQWKQVFPERPFEYFFIDETLQQLYQAEQRLGKLFGAFAALGIGIACLGLFGLATFAAEQRTKEISIRKVLGATVPNVVALLSKDFLTLVFIAGLIAAPIAWYVMHQWLEAFAYRIAISGWLFVFALLVALSIALLTVLFQTLKAARQNPAKTLKYE